MLSLCLYYYLYACTLGQTSDRNSECARPVSISLLYVATLKKGWFRFSRLDNEVVSQCNGTVSCCKCSTFLKSVLPVSVTRFGEFPPLWQNLTSLWQFCKISFCAWHHMGHTLAYTLCYWVNFLFFKWPKNKQIISPSGHTVKCLLRSKKTKGPLL